MFASKAKVAAVHLIISLIVVGITLGLIIFWFFPSIYVNATNFKNVAAIILLVDLVLGPLLTFVVFNKNKKTLKFDLSVVATIQIVAMLYGAYSLFQIHPVYIVFNIDRFTIIPSKDAEPHKATQKLFQVSKLSSANLAFAKMPTNEEEQETLLLEAISGGEDLDRKEEYYEPIENHASQILAKSLDPKIIFNMQTKNRFYKNYKNKLNSYAFLPLNNFDKSTILVLDKELLTPIATLDIDPWKLSKKNIKH